MAVATESANGTLTPPTSESQTSAPVSSSAKRKRSDPDHNAPANGLKLPNGVHATGHATAARIQGTLNALLAVLETEDSDALVLETVLPSATRSPVVDHANKKAKLSPSTDSTTVAARVKSGAYGTFGEFLEDVDTAVAQVTGPLLSREPTVVPGSYARASALSVDESRRLAGAFALQSLAKSLIAHDQQLHLPPTPPVLEDDGDDAAGHAVKHEKPAAAGVLEIKLEQHDSSTPSNTAGRNVLTLFGNAQGPKQLFSSLQKSSSALGVLGKRGPSVLEDDAKVALPIQDELLPNMISTTKILPVGSEDQKSTRAAPTFGEVFKAPASTRDLTPPKSRHSSSRSSNIITWEFPDSKPKRRTSYNYTTTTLTSGQWLGYRGFDGGPEPTSPEARRKQRDRALSTGEARPQLSEEAREAVEQAKEDALFRSVYSSFAPSRDDTGAIISSKTKGMVWWHKVGAQKFFDQCTVDESAIDPALMDVDSPAVDAADLDETTIKDAVDAYEEDLEPFSIGQPKATADVDTEEILGEVSDLLQTLDSYQRIRNSSLASTGHTRTPSMSQQRETVVNLSGSPTAPTAGELDVYNLLKSQLSILINSLPPFAVAKLNGDQLADLNIRKSLLVETKDYKGVMEEDHASRMARAATINAAVGQPQATRPTSQYGAAGYNRAAGGQLGSRPNNYYPQQQAPNNRTSASMGGGYSTPTSYSNAQPRANYSQQQAYNAAMSAGRGPGFSTTPLSNFNQSQSKPNSYSQYPRNAPAYNQNRNYAQPSPSANYQPRPSGAGPAQQAPMYNNYSSTPQGSASPHIRTASPLKPAPQRPAYATSSVTPSYGTPSNGNNLTRQPLSNGTSNSVGPSGFHSSMSNVEQHNLLDRQRAQLAQQQGKGHGNSASPAPQAA